MSVRPANSPWPQYEIPGMWMSLPPIVDLKDRKNPDVMVAPPTILPPLSLSLPCSPAPHASKGVGTNKGSSIRSNASASNHVGTPSFALRRMAATAAVALGLVTITAATVVLMMNGTSGKLQTEGNPADVTTSTKGRSWHRGGASVRGRSSRALLADARGATAEKPPPQWPPLQGQQGSRAGDDAKEPDRLYYCGALPDLARAAQNKPGGVASTYNKFGLHVARLLFPKFKMPTSKTIPLTKETLTGAGSNDLLVYMMHQYCDVPVQHFPGRALHINSEYYDLHPRSALNQLYNGTLTSNYLPEGERTYVLGTHEDVPQKSLRVTWMQLLLVTSNPVNKYKLFNPAHRQQNTRQHFCLYAQSHFVRHREETALALSKMGEIHTLGKCQGNPDVDVGGWVTDGRYHACVPYSLSSLPERIVPIENDRGRKMVEIMSDYRFALVMENVNRPGYITEKILNAFLSGAVPIYYGTTEILDIFNPGAFVYFDVNNPTEALERIRYLEQNKDAYNEVLKRPILRKGHRTVEKYFSLGDGVEGGHLKRRILDMMGYTS